MVPPSENSSVSAARNSKTAAGPTQEALEKNLAPETDPKKLAQEYAKLRERFTRTTNALASAAHDLKTPLAIMNGYVELLRGGKLAHLNDRQREVLSDMHSSGHRLQHFIQDFLTFSVLETGDIKLHYEIGDLNACLSDICRMWSQRFQEKGLALYFLPNEKLKEFPFDYAKVQRVVSNLLENASKYTPSGGTVWLHAEPHMWERRSVAKASAWRGAVCAFCSQCDQAQCCGHRAGNSCGIPDGNFRRLLPPSAERESSDGMGLGLAIARRLVNSMGGKVWVESEPGCGRKFSFCFPSNPSRLRPAKEK